MGHCLQLFAVVWIWVTCGFAQTSTSSVATVTDYPYDMPWAHRVGIWRDRASTDLAEACTPMALDPGTLVYQSSTIQLEKATYTPFCPNGVPVTYVKGSGKYQQLGTKNSTAWDIWINMDARGEFQDSYVPLVYSISSCAMVSLLLNLVIFVSPKRPLIQVISITISSVYLLVMFIRATNIIHSQYDQGYLDADKLRYDLETSTVINVLNMVFATIRLYAEVQTLMVLFSRQKEKRLVFWIGMVIIILSQVLWGVAIFHPQASEQDSALPAFVYLFQICMAVLYAACVGYYTVTKYTATLHRSVVVFSIITMMATCAPIAVFIVDVGGWWAVEWNDSVSWVTSILALVAVWEWAKRVEIQTRKNEKVRVLGRQVFEDENMFLPKSYVPGVANYGKDKSNDNKNGSNDRGHGDDDTHDSDNDDSDNGNNDVTDDNEQGNGNDRGEDTERRSLWNRYFRPLATPFVWVSDQIIAMGYFRFLARDSVKSPALHLDDLQRPPSVGTLDRHDHGRRNANLPKIYHPYERN